MNSFWGNLWAMFTNNWMYSTGETVVILVISFVGAIAIMLCNSWKTERDQRDEMTAKLGDKAYLDYLQWKAMLEETRK